MQEILIVKHKRIFDKNYNQFWNKHYILFRKVL